MAVNTDVFTGSDGSITLAAVTGSGPAGTEGKAAGDLIKSFNTVNVGRVQNITVQVTSEVRPYYEIGQRYAAELRPGNLSVKGTIGRAYVNGALLSLMLGDAAKQQQKGSWVQPSFNIAVQVANPAVPSVQSILTVHNVKFDTWSYNLPEDDFLMESLTFQALFVTVEDKAK